MLELKCQVSVAFFFWEANDRLEIVSFSVACRGPLVIGHWSLGGGGGAAPPLDPQIRLQSGRQLSIYELPRAESKWSIIIIIS